MLPVDKLSFWEKVTYLKDIDFLVIGSGIVGLCTALSLRKRNNRAKIVVLERGYLPTGASTKNAGFACFGSPSELLSDLALMGEERTVALLKLRWEGLQLLRQTVGDDRLDYQACGSYDLFLEHERETFDEVLEKLPMLNALIESALGLSSCYAVSDVPRNQGMRMLSGAVFNKYEGSINTGQMMTALIERCVAQGIHLLNGFDVQSFNNLDEHALVVTNFGEIQARQVLICTNGLSRKLLPELDLKPARAQVLVTSPIENLALNSTYHYDSGYNYFRVVDGNRVLIGGARNQDFSGETTESMEVTDKIKGHIVNLLRDVILPGKSFSIDYEWAGIMGVGQEKMPLIEHKSERICYAVRMGGMGVAMGMTIGDRLAQLAQSHQ